MSLCWVSRARSSLPNEETRVDVLSVGFDVSVVVRLEEDGVKELVHPVANGLHLSRHCALIMNCQYTRLRNECFPIAYIVRVKRFSFESRYLVVVVVADAVLQDDTA